jgi:hypothetical protein
MTWLLIQGTGIQIKECLGATAALMSAITFPSLLGRCANTTCIIICEETASECFPYVSTEPKIVQISAFLDSKDGCLNCVRLKVLIFKYLLSLKF